MKRNQQKSVPETLRRRAEALVDKRLEQVSLNLSEAEMLKLIHELQVHQVELEMQNEEIRRIWAEADEAAQEYTKLYDFAPLSYATLDKEGRILKLNLRTAQALGKERAHLVNSSLGMFVPNKYRLVFSRFLERVFDNQTQQTCEIELTSGVNSLCYVQLIGIVSEDGEQCLVAMTDITVQKRIEEIQQTRIHLLAFLDNHSLKELLKETLDHVEQLTGSSIGFWHFLEQDQKTLWLQCWSTQTLKDFCEVEGKERHSDISQAGVWIDCIRDRRTIIHNDFLSLPGRKGFPSGHPPVTRELVVPVFRDGKILAIMGVGNKATEYNDQDVECVELLANFVCDMAERKQWENSLKKNLALTEATLESIHNGILVVDHLGNVIKTNNQFAKMWHIPDDVIASGNNKTLINHVLKQLDDPGEFMEKLKGLYNNPEIEIKDLVYFKNGNVFERISKPMFIGDQPKGRVWSFLDITESERAKIVLENINEELKQINAEKDKLFSVIAHDLRSPFNGILGLSQLLVEEIPTMNTKQIQKSALVMKNSASRLYGVLENLLEWARMQRGITTFEPQPFLLMSIITESIQPFLEQADKKLIVINTSIPRDYEVRVDAYMAKSIFRNIVSNAVKFTPKGGKIIIKAKPLPSGFVEISIHDTGIGMNAQIRDHLFCMDAQTQRKGTDGEPSTGLGLIICKDFIEKHGGRISVESEEYKGSTFIFTLP